MVTSLSSTHGDNPGEVDLQWDAVKSARSYIVQFCRVAGADYKWKHIDIVIDSCCTVTGLSKGVKYGFRAAVISSEGQSKWCRPVFKKIEK